MMEKQKTIEDKFCRCCGKQFDKSDNYCSKCGLERGMFVPVRRENV